MNGLFNAIRSFFGKKKDEEQQLAPPPPPVNNTGLNFSMPTAQQSAQFANPLEKSPPQNVFDAIGSNVNNFLHSKTLVPGQVNSIADSWNNTVSDPNKWNLFHAMKTGAVSTGIQPLDAVSQQAGATLDNKIIKPATGVVQGVGALTNPNKNWIDRGIGGGSAVLNALMLTPGGIAFNVGAGGAYDAAKNAISEARQGRNPFAGGMEGFTGNKVEGLGSSLTNNSTLATIGNLAELPLTIIAQKKGGKAIEGIQANLKGLSPNSFKIHPDDQKILTDIIGKYQEGVKNSPDELKTLQTLADHYLGQKYSMGKTKKIMETFDYVLAKQNEGIPGNLPQPNFLVKNTPGEAAAVEAAKPKITTIDDLAQTLMKEKQDITPLGENATPHSLPLGETIKDLQNRYNVSPVLIKELKKGKVFDIGTGYIVKGYGDVLNVKIPEGYGAAAATEAPVAAQVQNVMPKGVKLKVGNSFDKNGVAIGPKKISGNDTTAQAVQAILNERLQQAATGATSAEDYLKQVQSAVDDVVVKAGKDRKSLAGIRAGLSKEMFGIAGAGGGDYKSNYATLKTIQKEDPELGPIIDYFETRIANIDDAMVSGKGIKMKDIVPPKIETPATQAQTIPPQQVEPMLALPAGEPKVYTPKQGISLFKKTGRQPTILNEQTPGETPIKLPSKTEEGRNLTQWENDKLNEIDPKLVKMKGKQTKAAIAGEIPTDTILEGKVKDKNPFSYSRETLQRNIEDTFQNPEDAVKVKAYLHDPILQHENESIQFKNTLREQLGQTFKSYGIKKGSKEDFAAADYIEADNKTKALETLTKTFGEDKAHNIIAAAEEGRQVYSNLLERINAEITKYGYEPIAPVDNYVTHTRQIEAATNMLGSLLNFDKQKLPTEISGINMDLKPGRNWFKFGLERKGGATHEGLITALDKYIGPATSQIFHTEDIQRGRALQAMIQNNAKPGDTRLSNFQSYLSQYVDSIAGKQNVIDRPFEKVFGRGLLNLGNGLRKRTGANMVGGNVSSAVTNFIPFTQSLATTDKLAAIKGMFSASTTPFKNPTVIDDVQSNFLARRFPVDKIAGDFRDNIQDAAKFLFKTVDEFTAHSIVGGKYFEGIQKGLPKEEAMKQADEYAARLMADRSFGQIPLLFNSKVLGTLTQFQLEVNNQMSFLFKDIPKNLQYTKPQIASALVQATIYSYLFNNIFEQMTGRRPALDPLHASITLAEKVAEGNASPADILDPTNQNTPVGAIANSVPFLSIFTGGRIPIGGALPDVVGLAKGDTTIDKEITKPLAFLAPPTGGGQIKKSIEGLSAVDKGYEETNKGQVKYPIEQDLANLFRGLLFGKYAFPDAQKYFSENNTPLGKGQSETFKAIPDSSTRQDYYQTVQDQRKQKNGEAVDTSTPFSLIPQADASEGSATQPNPVPPMNKATGISIGKPAGTNPTTPNANLPLKAGLSFSTAKGKAGKKLKVTAKKIAIKKLGFSTSGKAGIKLKAGTKKKKGIVTPPRLPRIAATSHSRSASTKSHAHA